MKLFYKFFVFRNKWISPYVQQLLVWSDGVVYFMSLLFLLTLVYKYGFSVSSGVLEATDYIADIVCKSFLIVNTLYLVFRFQEVRNNYRNLTWILNLLLYLTLLPVAFFQSHIYQIILLTLLSFLNLSNGLVRLMGKRTNPSLIFASSFFVLILVGTGLLMLPKSTFHGISVVDALFTSTSAVCVTGLTTLDVSTVFTPMGQFFILLLIQIGGLGVMTITSFFAIFFMGNTSIYNQLAVKDMLNSQSLNSLLSALVYILIFTLGIEGIGAVWLYANIHGTMGMTGQEELFFVIFHSISAFCNAGFSTLSGNLGNELLLDGHNGFYMGISILVILGGIGYPILVNFYETITYEVKSFFCRFILHRRYPRKVHLYNLNTRIVLGMTTFLLITGTLVILLVEWKNAFAGMPIMDKFVQAFFNAVCPRTAGFNSVSLSGMGTQTLLFYMLLMVIGGSTQSTAGGVKVNVFAVVLLNLRAIIKNVQRVTVYNREISYDSIRRSNATLLLYLLVVFVSLFMITILEPDLPVFSLLFECVSALSTVGSSLDITPQLGEVSKVLVIILMFVGRVGLLTFVASLIKQNKEEKFQYPSDRIIIN